MNGVKYSFVHVEPCQIIIFFFASLLKSLLKSLWSAYSDTEDNFLLSLGGNYQYFCLNLKNL